MLSSSNISFFEKVAAEKTVAEQWAHILRHPQLQDQTAVCNAVDRLTCIANHEAGCERANSKFNRSKNDLSSRMKLPMILARNRAGSIGPPIHLFDPKPILHYWKSQNRFLALKSKETDTSLVIQ